MTANTIALGKPRVFLRPLALPAEHGGWGFLLEPIVLGLLVAPSRGGWLIAAGAIGAFLARHPLKLAAQDWLRGKRYPRTRACASLAAAYAVPAGIALALVPLPALYALAAAIPFAALQFALDVRNHGRTLSAELAGVIAPGAIAMAVAIAGGVPSASAATLWLLLVLRGIPSILYVRYALRGEGRTPMMIAHAAAVAIASMIHPIAGLATLILFVRALVPVRGLAAKTIGMRELVMGVVTVLLFAVSR